jgi:hypothetical protein
METREQLEECWRREARLRARLTAFRLEAAQVERVWAVAAAPRQGLSIREFAGAVGLSQAWVHQRLADPVATELPAQLNRLRERGWPAPAADELDGSGDDPAAPGQEEDLLLARLTDEITALRECLDWLEQLERGERVMVNLLPLFHDDRDAVAFDRPGCGGSCDGSPATSTNSAECPARGPSRPDRRTPTPPNIAGGWPSPRRPRRG